LRICIVAIYEAIGNNELGKNTGINAFFVKRTTIFFLKTTKKVNNSLQMIDK